MKYLFHEPAAYCQLRKPLLIMRLTIILLVACMLQAGARGTAQTVTLSVTNMPLEKVCKEIERQTGYFFVYSNELNKTAHGVTATMTSVNINDALHQVFAGLPYTYQVIDKVVVVNTANKIDKANGTALPLADKLIRVEGIITTSQGRALPETSVTIKATGKGTITNAKGEFMLPAITAGGELIISHIGYATQTVIPKEGIFLEIKMEPAVSILDASVVKGYYTTSNRYNTGNVSTVKGEDIAKSPVTDPILALEGRVPGLSISQSSGVPGAYSKIQLRGQNTIPLGKAVTANDPLYIVDGVPFSSQSLTSEYAGGGIFQAPLANAGPGQGMSPFNSLNPADIESIEILKDADATAIYGSRGANGVILITTKRGKIGKNRIDLNIYTGQEQVATKIHLLNTPQYLAMRKEAFKNDNYTQYLIPQNANYYPDLLFWDTTRYTDWQKELIGRSASFTNAQISFSGGTANTQFIINGGYSKRGVVFPGDYVDQKGSLHVAVTSTSPNQRLHTQLSINYVNDNSNLPTQDLTQYSTLPPDAPPLFDANGGINWMPYNGAATWNNPLAYTATHAKAISEYMAGNMLVSYNLFKGADLKCNLGYSKQQMQQTILIPSQYFPPPFSALPTSRSSSFSNTNSQSWIIEPQVNYNKVISKGILELLIGSTFQENTANSRAEGGTGYSSDALISNIAAASSIAILGNNYSLYHYNAVFGRVGYNWAGKYIINLTGRRDGSSRFGPNRQFGNFGAIGGAWIFTKEKLIQDKLPFLSFGKIRTSFGVTGNDQIGDYQFLSTYSPYTLSYQGIVGLTPIIISNPYFEWERVKKLEGGLEIGLFKDLLMFTASYYQNRTDNQLVGFPLPAITGFNSVQANFPALIENKGWELTLYSRNITTKNFTWRSNFNITISRNKLVRYPGIEKSPFKNIYSVGHSLSSKYLFHYTGIDPQSGIYQFESKTGNGVPVFPDDRYISKPLSQTYFGGFQNSFSYQGFELDVLLQFVKQPGADYLTLFSLPGADNNQPIEILGRRWTKSGDISSVQRFSTGDGDVTNAYSNWTASDGTIGDISYIRVKNLSFSYQFLSEWLKKYHLESARIYLQCQNLFTITKYKGLDPEVQGFSLPPLRTITAGVQFSL